MRLFGTLTPMIYTLLLVLSMSTMNLVHGHQQHQSSSFLRKHVHSAAVRTTSENFDAVLPGFQTDTTRNLFMSGIFNAAKGTANGAADTLSVAKGVGTTSASSTVNNATNQNEDIPDWLALAVFMVVASIFFGIIWGCRRHCKRVTAESEPKAQEVTASSNV